MFNVQTFSSEIAGRTLTIETGKLANQAGGSCTVRYGDTVVLATACAAAKAKEGFDFFPLTVDYEEKLYAAGKIKGSRWIKREGRPSDNAVLTARLIDRSIRPLFNEAERREVQVVTTVLSLDENNNPDVLALIAASCALGMSAIAWGGPIAGVKVGRVDGELILNPSFEQEEMGDLELMIIGTANEIIMLESGSKEVTEADTMEAIKFGQKHIGETIKLIEEVIAKVGKEKIDATPEVSDEEKIINDKISTKVSEFIGKQDLTKLFSANKSAMSQNIETMKDSLSELLKADNEINKDERAKGVGMLNQYIDDAARDYTLAGKRIDGRAYDEVRALDAQVGILPRTHGTGLFTRGETQVLSVVTLGSPGAEQYMENIEDESITKKSFMHHYNFPGYSVGEVKRMMGTNRREIGHGALAEKALLPILPSKEDFPYTIRVVSEVMASNGSSSQASICGSSLALMDAGVPITKPVAGIAMGLVTNPKDKTDYRILTDIQGFEDHAGDMDLKVAGTTEGITAMQMDIKLGGIDMKVIEEGLEAAKKARLHILEVIAETIKEPRKEMSPFAPRITTLHIDPDQIRDVIGPGGKIINEIIEKTGVEIDIEQDGTVMITAKDAEGGDEAIQIVKDLTKKIQVGEEYEGKVMQIISNDRGDVGAIVQLTPHRDGMVHISNISNEHVTKIEDFVKVGEMLKVKVVEVDEAKNRIGLSHKEYTPEAKQSDNRNQSDNNRPRKPFNDKHKRF